MVVDISSYLESGDIIGWIVNVINDGTYGLGFPIAILTLSGASYLSNHEAGIAVAVMNILVYALSYFGLIPKEIAGPLQILAVVATVGVVFSLWKK